jgi:small subunit ribosomal protein S18
MTLINKKKYCYFKENGITEINYKDVKLLRRFITEQGKIMPRRVTGTSAKMHRKLVREIKRARNIALIPYTNINQEG